MTLSTLTVFVKSGRGDDWRQVVGVDTSSLSDVLDDEGLTRHFVDRLKGSALHVPVELALEEMCAAPPERPPFTRRPAGIRSSIAWRVTGAAAARRSVGRLQQIRIP